VLHLKNSIARLNADWHKSNGFGLRGTFEIYRSVTVGLTFLNIKLPKRIRQGNSTGRAPTHSSEIVNLLLLIRLTFHGHHCQGGA
jgi:hypothetical protein